MRKSKGWKNLSKQEKHAVWLRIRETHASGDRKKARKLRARYEKVSRVSGYRQATGQPDQAANDPAPGQSSGGT